MKRVEYKQIDLCFPVRVFAGRGKVTSVVAVNGVRLQRVIGDKIDLFMVGGPGVTPGLEIPSSNVAAGVPSDGPKVSGAGGHAD